MAKYNCHRCGKAFVSRGRVTMHKLSICPLPRLTKAKGGLKKSKSLPKKPKTKEHLAVMKGKASQKLLQSSPPSVQSNPDESAFCTKCGRVYHSRHSLLRHANYSASCRQSSRFRCDTCGYKSNDPCQFKRHASLHLEKSRKVTGICHNCRREFSDRTSLRRHVNFSATCCQGCRFRCDICGYKSSDASRFRVHVFRHLEKDRKPTKQWKCPKCRGQYLTSTALRRHQLFSVSCRTECRFKCDTCNYQSNTPKEFKAHILSLKACALHLKRQKIESHQVSKTVQNDVTGNIQQLERNRPHATVHWRCPKCSVVFGKRERLRHHLQYSASCRSDSRFVCPRCDYATNHDFIMRRHADSRTACSRHRSSRRLAALLGRKECKGCGRVFATTKGLLHHMDRKVCGAGQEG